ncbi:Hypp3339 [Branchiostoma lanceolatum]|uniref:Hypp3339 protein n=1 Tax=Branchiostoma lanceolatum TaxID=7740 RepID=A0A8K0EX10_BRALA|nr:Hypp3339 [Branchiostoma lanceolatum]
MSQMGALKTAAAVVCVSAILILLIEPTNAGSSFTTNPDIFDDGGDPSRRTLPPRADWEAAIADLVSRYRHLIVEILGDTSSGSSAAQERRSTAAPAATSETEMSQSKSLVQPVFSIISAPAATSETEMSRSQLRNVVNRYRQLILGFLRREEATDRAAQHNVSRSPTATGATEGK